MRSKSWLIILVIGILGLGALGFLTKFTLESNPSFLRLTKLKMAIAEDFSSQGVGEVSVRTLPGHRGFEIRIEAPRDRLPDLEAFVRSVAECFARKYQGPAPPFLKLSLLEPSGFGCKGSESYFQKEISMPELAIELELRSALQRLESAIATRKGFRVLSSDLKDPIRVKVEVPVPGNEAELEGDLTFLRGKAREHLSAGIGRVVVLELWSPKPGSALLREERIERAPSPRRKPVPPPAVRPAEARK